MKILQVVPKADTDEPLKKLLKEKERSLRGTTTTLVREREGRWRHKKYPGWITWDETRGGILVAEIRSKVEGADWQLLRSFVGYLDRHFGDQIESITITYR
jgi:hypothetical protein